MAVGDFKSLCRNRAPHFAPGRCLLHQGIDPGRARIARINARNYILGARLRSCCTEDSTVSPEWMGMLSSSLLDFLEQCQATDCRAVLKYLSREIMTTIMVFC